jgi:predicted permease
VIGLVALYPFSSRLEFFASTQIGSCYLNYIVIGLPIFTSIWGEGSAKIAVICPFCHYVFVVPLFLVLARLIETRGDDGITLRDVGNAFLSSIKTPILIGAFVGLAWSATGWTPFLWIDYTTKYTGNVVVVFSLICIGAFLCENSLLACHWMQLVFCLCLRFVIAPAIAIGWSFALRFPPTLARQCTILAAMPLSTVAYVVAVGANVGVGVTSTVVFWTVVLVVPVIMGWFFLLDSLGIFLEEQS